MFALIHRHKTPPKTPLSDFAGVVQFFRRRFFLPRRPTGERSLQLLESVPLTAETSIALVRFEREALVLGVTPRQVTVLVRRESPVVLDDTQTKAGTPLDEHFVA